MLITTNISFAPISSTHVKIGPSIGKVVACFEEAGLSTHAHALGINVQGEAGTIFAALRESINQMHESGAKRVVTTVQIDSESSAPTLLEEKIIAVRKPAA